MLFFGSFGLLMIFAMSPQAINDPVRMSQIASVALSDDDGGQSMFKLNRLGPGAPVSRCISVRYDGGPGGSEVRLIAQNVTDITAGGAGLANHIRVRISRGTGGNSSSCVGFTGSAIYSGSRSIADLTAVGGVGTGWTPTPNQTQTFQVTVWLRSDAPQQAQGARFNADLAWGMVTVGSVPVTPTTPPVVVPTTAPPVVPAVPTTAPPAEPTTVPSPAVVTTPPQPNANPSPAPRAPDTGTEKTTPTAAPAAPGGGDQRKTGGGGESAKSRPDAARSPLGSAVRNIKNVAAGVAKGITEFTKAAGTAAQGALRKPQYTSVAIGLMFLFLLAQDRFDRRDPKLALAPVTREPYLIFADSADAAEETKEYARFTEPEGG
ncbi:hypothetical protein [Pilimelia terevasa]|nr:hypothetical protein [Pilimelia terevasa]